MSGSWGPFLSTMTGWDGELTSGSTNRYGSFQIFLRYHFHPKLYILCFYFSKTCKIPSSPWAPTCPPKGPMLLVQVPKSHVSSLVVCVGSHVFCIEMCGLGLAPDSHMFSRKYTFFSFCVSIYPGSYYAISCPIPSDKMWTQKWLSFFSLSHRHPFHPILLAHGRFLVCC